MKGEFLWASASKQLSIRDRSNLPAASKKFKYIAPEEVQLALEKVVRESIAIQPEAAVTYVARLFGFNRVTEEAREEILKAIDLAMEQKQVVNEGGLLTLAE